MRPPRSCASSRAGWSAKPPPGSIPFTMLGGSYRFTAEHLAAIVRQYEQQPVIASADEPSRAAARHAAATQLPNDIKVKPLRARPRRAA